MSWWCGFVHLQIFNQILVGELVVVAAAAAPAWPVSNVTYSYALFYYWLWLLAGEVLRLTPSVSSWGLVARWLSSPVTRVLCVCVCASWLKQTRRRRHRARACENFLSISISAFSFFFFIAPKWVPGARCASPPLLSSSHSWGRKNTSWLHQRCSLWNFLYTRPTLSTLKPR